MSTPEENKALARRRWEGVYNERNLGLTDEVYDPGFVYEAPGFDLPAGPEGVRWAVAMAIASTPDIRITIEDLIAEGDKVVTRWTTRGTHTGGGGFFGIPPTGKPVVTAGITIHRLAGGKIVEGWNQIDALGLLQQLGVTPAPAQIR
jgi:predicted ester cyclase